MGLDLRAGLIAYLDLLRFQLMLTELLRERTGEGITILDTIVNLEVYLFSANGGTLQQEVINSLDAPRSSVRDSLKRLVRAGLVLRNGDRYQSSPETLRVVTELREDLCLRLARLAESSKPDGRSPPL